MKTVIKMFPVYTFEELSNESKEKAKQDFLDTELRNLDFQDISNEEVNYHFPNSDLKYAYSLSNCQGDGWTIYGKLDFSDIMEKISEKYTDKEQRTLNWCMDEFMPHGMNIELSRRNFCFTPWDYEELLTEMEIQYIRNIPYDLIERFGNEANFWLRNFCQEMERMGYEYLYNVSNSDMEDISNANDWMYLEDGTFYTG